MRFCRFHRCARTFWCSPCCPVLWLVKESVFPKHLSCFLKEKYSVVWFCVEPLIRTLKCSDFFLRSFLLFLWRARKHTKDREVPVKAYSDGYEFFLKTFRRSRHRLARTCWCSVRLPWFPLLWLRSALELKREPWQLLGKWFHLSEEVFWKWSLLL